jgi:hypothetical protein
MRKSTTAKSSAAPHPKPLDDLELILLSTAASRDDGSVLPLAQPVEDDHRTHQALAMLLGQGLIARAPAGARRDSCVTNAEMRAMIFPADAEPGNAESVEDPRIGLVITDAGCKAIGVEIEPGTSSATGQTPVDPSANAEASAEPELRAGEQSYVPRAGSKQALVLDLLGRDGGVSLDDLTAATGWLPHSARAVLSGLRKHGHTIACEKRDGASCYRLVEAG